MFIRQRSGSCRQAEGSISNHRTSVRQPAVSIFFIAGNFLLTALKNGLSNNSDKVISQSNTQCLICILFSYSEYGVHFAELTVYTLCNLAQLPSVRY